MASIVEVLAKKQLVTPPSFIKNSVQYEVMMGSVAYAISNDTSDIDVYGYCIPPKEYIFPHLDGKIIGFGKAPKKFDVWQQHHIKDLQAEKEYDCSIYSIIRYFQLVMENNPNMIDSLFVPRRCVLHTTQIGEYVREHRKTFLHKGSWHKFKGYAYSQVHKMNIKKPDPGSKRYPMVQKFGYDVKFAAHTVRLLNEIEQIMMEGDLDLERNREQLKSIRRGEWPKLEILNYFAKKESELESLYSKSPLPHSPDEEKIKTILLNCLELYFGNIDNAIKLNYEVEQALKDIENCIEEIRKKIKK